MTTPKTITADWLRQQGGCEDQVTKFAAEWPAGAEITQSNLMRAANLRLDIDWLALRVLPRPLQMEYRRRLIFIDYEYLCRLATVQVEHELERLRIVNEYTQQVAVLLWSIIDKQQGGKVKCGRRKQMNTMGNIKAHMRCSCGVRLRQQLTTTDYPILCPICLHQTVTIVDRWGGPGAHCPNCHWPEVRP